MKLHSKVEPLVWRLARSFGTNRQTFCYFYISIRFILSLHNILFQELKKQFKKKSMLLLPEKHPSVANAHSRFVELNNAFITVSF